MASSTAANHVHVIPDTFDLVDYFLRPRARSSAVQTRKKPAMAYFQALPSPERSRLFTRVFQLAPGSGDDPLKGHLQTVDITSPPFSYEALSHHPGLANDPSAFLWIQNHAVPIRPNLEAALLALRDPEQPRALWVDALCVNKDDVDEHSRQVRDMSIIYKQASRIIAWLGPKTEGMDLAFELAHRLARIREVEDEQDRLSEVPVDSESREEVREVFLHGLSPENLHQLHEMFRRPYFTHYWCVVEVMAAAEVIVKSGDLEISFNDIGPSLSSAAQANATPQQDSPLEVWWKVWANRPEPGMPQSHVPGSMGSALELLETMRCFNSDDVRDRVFGLRGICDEGLDPIATLTRTGPLLRRTAYRGLQLLSQVGAKWPGRKMGSYHMPALAADYRKSDVQTYVDLTRFLIHRPPGDLDVLNLVDHNVSEPDGYPTWVPKWFEKRGSSVMHSYFRAGLVTGRSPCARVHDNPSKGSPKNPLQLSLDGFWVDNIESVSDVLSFEIGTQEANILLMEQTWSHFFPSSLADPSGQQYRDSGPLDVAFCEALSAGGLPDAPPVGILPVSDPDNIVQQFVECRVDDGRQARAFLDRLGQARSDGEPVPPLYGDAAQFFAGVVKYANARRVFLTKHGRLGLGPKGSRAEDKVVVFFGAPLPFVVRKMQDHYQLIGQCYVVDSPVMAGEVAEQVYRNKMASETYNLR
ncbi:unnamed protein product [Clonostachys chloroleuca]|uniref:Heterokaryon incompatibility domain-containing protein n=1 Tax=Clonostachys chloroleuca TaxID=1926264 RepID=A0AA35QC06_9HYPO|nr:unnamed protein product [Clonostachys chloroleuca]